MKHYSTAKEILEESIKDIAAGHWCKGNLAEYGETKGGTTFSNEQVGCDTSAWDSFIPFEKPMGCAIGLISTYGGLGSEFEQQVDGVTLKSFEPEYPNSAYSLNDSAPVVEALKALYDAAPGIGGTGDPGFDLEIDDVETAIYEYNDSSECTQPVAEAWFRRALALVNAQVKA